MWRKKKKVPALTADANEEIAGVARAQTVGTTRQIKVLIEREVCSLTVHGQLVLTDQQSCPMCGQSLLAGHPELAESANEVERGLPNNKGD